mmetsp:Transcript_24787/g.63058  ORF Transcript_24787/g.63058 Transcript_24787/m.63058 type:complete len:213 (+) Transcript_24787:1355-1993(+)
MPAVGHRTHNVHRNSRQGGHQKGLGPVVRTPMAAGSQGGRHCQKAAGIRHAVSAHSRSRAEDSPTRAGSSHLVEGSRSPVGSLGAAAGSTNHGAPPHKDRGQAAPMADIQPVEADRACHAVAAAAVVMGGHTHHARHASAGTRHRRHSRRRNGRTPAEDARGAHVGNPRAARAGTRTQMVADRPSQPPQPDPAHPAQPLGQGRQHPPRAQGR